MGFLQQHRNNGHIPYYTGLQIQTSGNNVPIAIVWGANKIAPNCIWTGGFYAYYGYPEPGTGGNTGSGKGGGSSTGSTGSQAWQYYTSFEMGLCEGPIQGLGTIWSGQNVTNTYGGDIWAVYYGTQTQTPWNVLTTYFAGQALSYHGLAYITSYNYYLGSSGNLPQFSIEVFGVLFGSSGINGGDADPAQVIQDFLTNPQYGVGFPAASIDATSLFSPSVQTISISIGSPAVITWPSSAPAPGTAVVLMTTGALPAGLSTGTVYYVINSSGATSNLSVTYGGTPINTSGTQSGTQTASWDNSYQGYCRASYLAISPALTNHETASSILARWLQITNTAAVWSGGLLRFIPYGDSIVGPTPNKWVPGGVSFVPHVTPVYSLTDDDFIREDGKDPVEITRADPFSLYNWRRLQINQRIQSWLPVNVNEPWVIWENENSYQNMPVDAWDQNAIETYGLRMAPDITANEICDPQVGQVAAQLILQRGLYIRNHYKFKLSWEYCLLDPMDLVNITDSNLGLNNVTVRITEIEEDDNGILSITAEEFPGGVASPVRYQIQTGGAGNSTNQSAVPARVNPPVIFEPPSSLTGGIPKVFIAASGGVAPVYALNETAGGTLHYTYQNYTGSVASGSTVVFSLFVQANTRSAVRLNIFNGSAQVGADFSINGTSSFYAADAGVTASMTQFAAGSSWYQIIIYTTMAATAAPGFYVYLETLSGTTFSNSYSGTAGDGVYIWGAGYAWQAPGGSPSGQPTFLPAFTSVIGSTLATSGAVTPPEGVAGKADPNWGGANVWLSTDGNTYTQAGQILGPSRQGYLTAALPAPGGSNPDTVNTLSVNLAESGGTLSSGTAVDAQNGVTLCLVDNELLSYETATLTSANAYNLTTLYRGVDGTSPAAHSIGAPFVRVDDTIFQYALPASFIGVTIYVKLQSFNVFGQAIEDLAECQVFTYTPTGAGSPIGPVTQALQLGQNLDFGSASAAVTESDQWGIVTDGIMLAKIDLGAGI